MGDSGMSLGVWSGFVLIIGPEFGVQSCFTRL